jgi:hypothetical protein
MKRAIVPVLLVLLSAFVLAACGESKEDKAKKTVCSARSDINEQINTLKGLTPATATVQGVTESLNAIKTDLQNIKDAQGDLKGSRKEQVQAANQQFTSQLSSIVSTVARSLSASDAKAQLNTALQELTTSYQQTFAKTDCS